MVTDLEVEIFASELRTSSLEQRKSAPGEVTPRMCAYLRAYCDRFGRGFSLKEAMEVEKLPAHLMKTYKVESGKFADRSLLASQLADCMLLTNSEDFMSFEITDRGQIMSDILGCSPLLSFAGNR